MCVKLLQRIKCVNSCDLFRLSLFFLHDVSFGQAKIEIDCIYIIETAELKTFRLERDLYGGFFCCSVRGECHENEIISIECYLFSIRFFSIARAIFLRFAHFHYIFPSSDTIGSIFVFFSPILKHTTVCHNSHSVLAYNLLMHTYIYIARICIALITKMVWENVHLFK